MSLLRYFDGVVMVLSSGSGDGIMLTSLLQFQAQGCEIGHPGSDLLSGADSRKSNP
jgi:hypothetical protein